MLRMELAKSWRSQLCFIPEAYEGLPGVAVLPKIVKGFISIFNTAVSFDLFIFEIKFLPKIFSYCTSPAT